jgi:hypothetical protein
VTLVFSLLAGCGSQSTALSGEDRNTVLAFSEAKTDNLLAGMNANDYALFSKDFDQDMLNAMSQTEFAKLKKDRDAKFEKDDAVTVRVVFRVAEPHQVSGLWFNK